MKNNNTHSRASEKRLKKLINKKILVLRKKYFVSLTIWVLLNVSLIVITTFLGLLSAYSITKNTNPKTLWIFVTLAIVTSVIAFLNNLFNVLEISERADNIKKEIRKLSESKEKIREMTHKEFQAFLIEVAASDLFWRE